MVFCCNAYVTTDIYSSQYLAKKHKGRSVVRPFEGDDDESEEVRAKPVEPEAAGTEPEPEPEPEPESEPEPETEPEPEPEELEDAEEEEEEAGETLDDAQEQLPEDKEGQVKAEYKDAVHTAPPAGKVEYILPLITKSSNLRTNGMRASWEETFLLDEVRIAYAFRVDASVAIDQLLI
jgi:hypothetical protein